MAASRGYVITSSSPPRHEVSVATDVSMRATDSNVAFISLFLLGCIGFPLTDHAIADGDLTGAFVDFVCKINQNSSNITCFRHFIMQFIDFKSNF